MAVSLVPMWMTGGDGPRAGQKHPRSKAPASSKPPKTVSLVNKSRVSSHHHSPCPHEGTCVSGLDAFPDQVCSCSPVLRVLHLSALSSHLHEQKEPFSCCQESQAPNLPTLGVPTYYKVKHSL